MPFLESKYPLPKKIESEKWIHYPLNDNLQLRVLKEAIVERQQNQHTEASMKPNIYADFWQMSEKAEAE